MTGLVLHALWVSVLLGLAAATAEPVARALRLPTRFTWGVAMLGSVALVGWGLSSPTPVPLEPAPAGVTLSGDASASVPHALGHSGRGWWDRLSPLPGIALAAAHDRIPSPGPAIRTRGARLFALAWAGGSVLLVALLAGGALHHRRTRRRWPRESVLGHPVRIAPEGGPAVAGFLDPEILVPRWALELPEGELRLILRHEDEHRRARDPLLLGAASLLVALTPWNPVLWWQLRRLRDALEVDCDTRVLGRSRLRGRSRDEDLSTLPARPYAELLLRVGSMTPARSRSHLPAPAPFVTPAIGGSPTQLERRILAMRTHRPRPLFLASASGAVVLLATAACLADRPTPVEPTDEAGASRYTSVQSAGELGAPARAETGQAEASTPAAAEGTPRYEHGSPLPQVEVSEARTEGDVTEFEVISVGPGPQGPPEGGAVVRSPSGIDSDGPAPLIVVDGVILNARSVDEAQIAAGDIISIQVTRGEVARDLYGPRAAGGVINISTRAGEEWRARNPPPQPPATTIPPGGN